MMIWFTKLQRDIQAKTVRTVLVVLSIALGVMALTTVLGTPFVTQPALSEAYLATTPADIDLTTYNATPNHFTRLAQLPNVQTVEGVFVFQSRWRIGEAWVPLIIEAMPNVAEREIGRLDLIDGSLPNGEITLLLERTALELADLAPNDDIIIQTPAGERPLTISGIVHNAETPSVQVYRQGTAFMDLETAVFLLGTFDYNRINIRVHDETKIAETGQAVLNFMRGENLPVLAKGERTLGDYPGQKAFDKVLKLMALFGLLALLLSAFIIINTVVTILSSETGQIGTMKAIGATRWHVMGIYLAVVGGYGLLGGLLGLLLGTIGLNLLTRYMGSLANVRVETIYMLPLPIVTLGLSLGLFVPLLATLIPIIRTTGITVRQAILSYGLGSKGSLFDLLIGRITLLPDYLSVAIRNTLRQKGRTLLTLLMIGLAGASFVSIQAMQSSLNRTVDVVSELLAADVSVVAQNPLPIAELDALIGNDGIKHREGWLVMSDENDAGEFLRIYGLPVETTLYNHRGADTLSAGRYFVAADVNAVLVTTAWAQQHGVTVGDIIQFGKLLRQEWEVVGIVNDFANEGRVFAVPYATLGTELGLTGFSNWMQIELANGTAGDQLVTRVGLEALRRGEQVSATTKEELTNSVKTTFALIVTFISTMGIVVAVVSALGLVSTLTIGVAERVKEIGVMRSIGASDQAVAMLFWWEGILLGLLGWGISLLVGIPVARLFVSGFAQEFPVVFELNPLTLVLSGVAILCITSIASIFPAVAASRLRVGDILRYG